MLRHETQAGGVTYIRCVSNPTKDLTGLIEFWGIKLAVHIWPGFGRKLGVGTSHWRLDVENSSISLSKKNKVISEMGEWTNGRWFWIFRWKGNLSERERALVDDLHAVLNGYPLTRDISSSCIWTAEPEGSYSVQSVYKTIHAPHLGAGDPIFFLWISAAPSNVCVHLEGNKRRNFNS